MFDKVETLLIKFILGNLFSREQINSFLNAFNITIPSKIRGKNKEEFIESIARIEGKITLANVREYARYLWKKPDIERHIKNLKSGKLKGHGWHGAMPSTLHLSLQAMIRNYVNSGDTGQELNDLIGLAGDIMKHEYFIVAVADICESAFIDKFADTIPSIASRGVIDFVFGGIPYDLKNSVISGGWTFIGAQSEPERYIKTLVAGADVERMRREAIGLHENWGNNRLYVITEYEDIWMDNPEKALGYLQKQASIVKEKVPFEISIDGGLTFLAKIIFIPRELR